MSADYYLACRHTDMFSNVTFSSTYNQHLQLIDRPTTIAPFLRSQLKPLEGYGGSWRMLVAAVSWGVDHLAVFSVSELVEHVAC